MPHKFRWSAASSLRSSCRDLRKGDDSGDVDCPASTTFPCHVAELQRRDLVQRRSVWRAVLPHAIANRLAAVALENLPRADIDRWVSTAPGRLLKSFSRRLSYLHASENARSIARGWLAPGGLLAGVADLNDLGQAMLRNIAPVAPGEVLSALEAICVQEPSAGKDYFGLLRSLA